MRIPKVQSLIKEVFGQDPGKRLNSEECVAKVWIFYGCVVLFLFLDFMDVCVSVFLEMSLDFLS